MFQYSYKSKNIKIHKYINIENLNSKNLIKVLETSIHKKYLKLQKKKNSSNIQKLKHKH
jgi:hypothetical protein